MAFRCSAAYRAAVEEETSVSASRRKTNARREKEIEELILSHRENGRKLARSMLRRWRVRMPADEIDSVVDLALCEAAQRYSSCHGASFMTFLFYHLRGHLVRAVARAAQVSNVFLTLAQGVGVDTSDWNTTADRGAAPVVPEYLLHSQRDAETPENIVLRRERISLCRQAYDKLDDLEKEILDRSFASEESLVQVARVLGYSRCHISRVKKGALDRMKALLDGVEAERARKESMRKAPSSSVRKPIPIEKAMAKRRSRRRAVGRIRVSVQAKAA